MTPEREWRQLLLHEIREIKKEIHQMQQQLVFLKLKMASVSAIASLIITMFVKYISNN